MENDRKWIYLSYVVLIALTAWVLHKTISLGLGMATISNPKILQVAPLSAVIGTVVAVVAGFIYFSRPHVGAFALEVLQELKKVTWPDKETTYKSTIVVVIFVMIASFALGLFDWITNWVVSRFV